MRKYNFIYVLSIMLLVLMPVFNIFSSVSAEIIERVVGIVNDDVIFLSEFNTAYASASTTGTVMSEEEFLNDMISRKLILEQARRFRFKGSTVDDISDNLLIETYLERRIKAFIHIPFGVIETYYIENAELFKGAGFFDVRDEIEAFLIDERLGTKILEHIEELRNSAYVKVQLKPYN